MRWIVPLGHLALVGLILLAFSQGWVRLTCRGCLVGQSPWEIRAAPASRGVVLEGSVSGVEEGVEDGPRRLGSARDG